MADELTPTQLVERTLNEYYNASAAIEEYTSMFTRSLFDAIERFVSRFAEAGLPGISKPRRIDLPTGKQALQLSITDYKIIFVPLAGTARPNLHDEARVPGARFKEECGRIAVFVGETPDTNAFYDFLIWGDGSWFAWGYGWPKQADEYASTEFDALAADLVASFIKDIHRTWKPRAETTLGPSTDPSPIKRAFVFGLPGDE